MDKHINDLINKFLKISGFQIVKVMHEKDKKNYVVSDFTLKNIFDGFPRWVSGFEIEGKFYGGQADYTSKRISMLNEERLYELIDFKGQSVIEFGPLEGGNTIILEKLGAKYITAIEGQIENYIRCCVIKNLFRLNRSTFHFDNVMNVKIEKYGKHDIAFVAGLFYHLDSPHIFLEQVAIMADAIIISTHYADEESPSPDADIKEIHYKGFRYRGKLFKESVGPNSGLQSFSFWPFREDLLNMMYNTGYKQVHIIGDLTDKGTHYKLIYLVAKKSD
jgi:hypothetical protein